MFIPDTGSNFFHPASRVGKIPDPDPHQRIKTCLTQKTDTKFSKIRSGMFIPDPGFGFFSIPDTGFNKAPDPRSGSATLLHGCALRLLLLTYLSTAYDRYRYLFLNFQSMLGIRDILVRMPICGSVPLTNESGFDFGSDSFLQ